MSVTPHGLAALMDSFYGGTDGRTRHPFKRDFIYTEGAKAVADLAGAYWLLDIVATEVAPICLKRWRDEEDGQSFLHFNVEAGGKAELFVDDGMGKMSKKHWSRVINYTDFPMGNWTFYLFMDGVVEYPKEVLVMLLPQED
jgi:hypothetical protein